MGTEKMELKMALAECEDQLKASGDGLDEEEVKLVELKTHLDSANEAKRAAEIELGATIGKLRISRERLNGAGVNLVELCTQFAMANETKSIADVELKATNIEKEVAESRLTVVVEAGLRALLSIVGSLEKKGSKRAYFFRGNCCQMLKIGK
ncbi:unnamed protein product [Ilex paraguariensis]|uniref:Uncharacterized protein n=1 Tax=Ilex paraguariensis TaxID=185542 RepID=A0ABC8TB53_9AQUA